MSTRKQQSGPEFDWVKFLLDLAKYLNESGVTRDVISAMMGWLRSRKGPPSAEAVKAVIKKLDTDGEAILGPRPAEPSMPPLPPPEPPAPGGGRYNEYLFEEPTPSLYSPGDQLYILPRRSDRDIWWVRRAGTNDLLPGGAMLLRVF
jgi:hypothetical protein